MEKDRGKPRGIVEVWTQDSLNVYLNSAPVILLRGDEAFLLMRLKRSGRGSIRSPEGLVDAIRETARGLAVISIDTVRENILSPLSEREWEEAWAKPFEILKELREDMAEWPRADDPL